MIYVGALTAMLSDLKESTIWKGFLNLRAVLLAERTEPEGVFQDEIRLQGAERGGPVPSGCWVRPHRGSRRPGQGWQGFGSSTSLLWGSPTPVAASPGDSALKVSHHPFRGLDFPRQLVSEP